MTNKKKDVNETIIKNLQSLMFEKQVTQADLARRLNTTAQNISPYFTKRRNFGHSMLKNLATALGVNVKVLLTDIGIPEHSDPVKEDKLSPTLQTIIKEFTSDEGAFMMILIKK